MKSASYLSRTFVALGVCAALAETSAAQLADSPWPKFQHDAQNTGRSDLHTGPLAKPSIVWERSFKGPRRATPALAADGTIYLGVGRLPLMAIEPLAGTELWGTSNGNGSDLDRAAPAVAADGTVYFGARNNDIWSVGPLDGSTKWRFHVPTDGDVSTPPTIGPDGRVYMGSDSLGAGRFYALHPDGSVDWTFKLGGAPINTSPALSHDGKVVYTVSGGKRLHALSTADGSRVFEPVTGQAAASGTRACNYSPVVGKDGTIYFTARSVLTAVRPDGTEKWRFDPSGMRFASPVALAPDANSDGVDDVVYAVGSSQVGTLFALDPADGSVLWREELLPPGKAWNVPPVVGADGTIYIGVGKVLYAFDPAGDGQGGGQTRWMMLFRYRFVSSPIIGGDGLLYVGNGHSLFKLSDR